MKFNQNLSRVRNVMFHKCFTYTLARFMFFVTTIATHIFLNITNIFQLNHNYLAAVKTAKTTKCN